MILFSFHFNQLTITCTWEKFPYKELFFIDRFQYEQDKEREKKINKIDIIHDYRLVWYCLIDIIFRSWHLENCLSTNDVVRRV